MPEVKGELELCANGYHLAREKDLIGWLNATIYEAEPSTEMMEGDDKVVCRSVRLLRKMNWNESVTRLFACDCAERALPIYERDYPKDKRPREAIRVARMFAQGKATNDELAAAWAAAGAAAWAAAGAAAWAAARAAAWDAAWAAEHKWQAKRLMQYLKGAT